MGGSGRLDHQDQAQPADDDDDDDDDDDEKYCLMGTITIDWRQRKA